MLIRCKGGSVVTVVLVDGPHLDRSIAKGREANLGGDDPGLRCECSLIKRDVKIDGAEGKDVERRFLGGGL